MSFIEEQAWDNLRALGSECGLRGQVIRLESMGVPARKAEDWIVYARDKRNPYSAINACISRWRADNG